MTPRVRASLVRQARENPSRARLCEIVGLLLDHHAAEVVAREIGVSSAHVRNLARVRHQLVPEAWAAFEVGRVSLKEALRLSACLPDVQRKSLRKSA